MYCLFLNKFEPKIKHRNYIHTPIINFFIITILLTCLIWHKNLNSNICIYIYLNVYIMHIMDNVEEINMQIENCLYIIFFLFWPLKIRYKNIKFSSFFFFLLCKYVKIFIIFFSIYNYTILQIMYYYTHIYF